MVYLNKRMASTVHKGSSLAQGKKSQVLLLEVCSMLDPDHIDTLLRLAFPKMREMEKRTGQAVPSTNRASRPKTFTRKPNAREVQENRGGRTCRIHCSRRQRRAVLPRQHSLLGGVPGRRGQASERQEASSKRR